MKPAVAALIAGVVGGGAAVGYLAWQKKVKLEAKVAGIEAAIASGDPSAGGLARQAVEARGRIERAAEQRATQIAKTEAERYIMDTFGLTPERIAGIDRLSRTLGV